MPGAKRKRAGPAVWADWPTARLLEVRMCDLGLRLEGTWVQAQIERVQLELRDRDLRLRPHFWLSEEWFSPDGVPGVAIPFYLGHPRLMRLERQQMLEVEGGTPRGCVRLLRHELGHAMQHGWQLGRRGRWREIFGPGTRRYPQRYRPNPGSKRFVQHLDGWYAQSHPVEDFAETFAVWLDPKSRWRKVYARWPARRKLEYVEDLMQELAGRARIVDSRARPYALSGLTHTLREHYARKKATYSVGYSEAYDADLRRLFAEPPARGEAASKFLRRHRRALRELVNKWTGDDMFTTDQILKQLIGRCRELKLVARGPARGLFMDFAILLTVSSTSYVYRGREWHAM